MSEARRRFVNAWRVACRKGAPLASARMAFYTPLASARMAFYAGYCAGMAEAARLMRPAVVDARNALDRTDR